MTMIVSNSVKEEWTYEDLQDEAEELRKRLNRFRISLGRYFVEKQELIDLMLIAAIAQEPLLLVGPPGTAKSDLVLKFKDALGLVEGDYFEYMLTRLPSRRRSSAPSTSASCATAATSAASRASCRPRAWRSSTKSSSRT